MLIEFRVANHRSICDEQTLTMEAGRVGNADDLRPREVVGYAEKILPVAALFCQSLRYMVRTQAGRPTC